MKNIFVGFLFLCLSGCPGLTSNNGASSNIGLDALQFNFNGSWAGTMVTSYPNYDPPYAPSTCPSLLNLTLNSETFGFEGTINCAGQEPTVWPYLDVVREGDNFINDSEVIGSLNSERLYFKWSYEQNGMSVEVRPMSPDTVLFRVIHTGEWPGQIILEGTFNRVQ